MSVQQNASVRISPMWAPIHLGNSSTRERVQAGRLASRACASAVMCDLLLKQRQLPRELVRETALWLKSVDRKTEEALCKLKAAIDSSESGFANAAKAREWKRERPSYLYDVEQVLRNAHAEARANLPPKLSREFDEKLKDFEAKIDAGKWEACCEIMSALDSLVSDELMKSPSRGDVG
jgi:hypothetical protein